MEKTIKVGAAEYKMKSTAANLLKYKAQFGRDLLADVEKMQKAQNKDGTWNFGAIDLEVMYDMVWLLIKAANPEIPAPMEWLDSLDTFPIKEAATEAMTLYVESMKGTATVKNA